jgi:hypothetical protein
MRVFLVVDWPALFLSIYQAPFAKGPGWEGEKNKKSTSLFIPKSTLTFLLFPSH